MEDMNLPRKRQNLFRMHTDFTYIGSELIPGRLLHSVLSLTSKFENRKSEYTPERYLTAKFIDGIISATIVDDSKNTDIEASWENIFSIAA